MTDTRRAHITVHPPDCRCLGERAAEPDREPDEEEEDAEWEPMIYD